MRSYCDLLFSLRPKSHRPSNHAPTPLKTQAKTALFSCESNISIVVIFVVLVTRLTDSTGIVEVV